MELAVWMGRKGSVVPDNKLQTSYLFIDLVLLVFVYPFRLDKQQRVVKEEHKQVRIFALRSAATLQRALVHQLAILVTEM
jgi:uncharacterized membrane protein